MATVPLPSGPITGSGSPPPLVLPGIRWTCPSSSTKYWLSGSPEPSSEAKSAASSALSEHSGPRSPCSSTCPTRADVRSRSVKSTWAAIIRQAPCPAPSAFLLSGTFRTFWSSVVSEVTPLFSAVPSGKRESTTGRSQFEGPSSSVRTVWVAVSIRVTGSVRLRT